jgi:hypothetical protein
MVVLQTTIALCLTTADGFRSNLVVRRLAIVLRQTTLCVRRVAMVVRGQRAFICCTVGGGFGASSPELARGWSGAIAIFVP